MIIPGAGGFPGLDVAAVEEELIVINACVGVGDVYFAGAD